MKWLLLYIANLKTGYVSHLLLAVNHLHNGLADGLEGVAVDVVHVVDDSVPRGTEGALLTVGIVGDDVDAGDAGLLVHGDMVVGDTTAITSEEETLETHYLGSTPHLADDLGGILLRH